MLDLQAAIAAVAALAAVVQTVLAVRGARRAEFARAPELAAMWTIMAVGGAMILLSFLNQTLSSTTWAFTTLVVGGCLLLGGFVSLMAARDRELERQVVRRAETSVAEAQRIDQARARPIAYAVLTLVVGTLSLVWLLVTLWEVAALPIAALALVVTVLSSLYQLRSFLRPIDLGADRGLRERGFWLPGT